ncbi:MAG: hypothetical protein QM811_16470 [Pirellulales bacterium]
MLVTKTVSTYIDCPPNRIYDYVRDANNLPHWAKNFVRSVSESAGGWKIETEHGQLDFRFAPHNTLGVLDHFIRLPTGDEVFVPMRVVANDEGAEVLFTIFRTPIQSDADFARDQELVRGDLRTLKIVLEVE